MAFSHERLKVYQRALDLVAWSEPLLAAIPSGASVKSQLDRAATSAALNIAEGNTRASAKDRRRLWNIALGSAVECAGCLDVAVAKGYFPPTRVQTGKALAEEVARMLIVMTRDRS